jgi:hypothetical protein
MPALHVAECRVAPGEEVGLSFVLPAHTEVLVPGCPEHFEDFA